jgi:TRAP-type C4-dicarboxylate transport system substrate-binding protein
MSRRQILRNSVLLSAAALAGVTKRRGVHAQTAAGEWPRRIIMAGHAPDKTSFSRGLALVGDRLVERFGEQADLSYVFNVADLGYDAQDLLWLVDSEILTLAYSTPLAYGVPALEIAALPFIFKSTAEARAAMDGALGNAAIESIESRTDYRVLGFFENGFRHISNNVRPVTTPADLSGLKIRVLGVQESAFRALGADVRLMPIAATIPLLADGTLDGQENPFENIVAYGAFSHQRYYTATFHSYMSRPIFVHRPGFEAWPVALQDETRAAVRAAIAEQRALHDQAEIDSQAMIREAGGEIIELTFGQRAEFVAAVQPVYAEARSRYDPALLGLAGL